MKSPYKISIALTLFVALVLPLTHATNQGDPFRPAAAFALSAPANPIGTNVIVDVVRQQIPAVVGVQSIKKVKKMRGLARPNPFLPGQPRQRPPQGGMGSGFIIDPMGLVLTNHHVVDGADTLKIRLHNDKEYTATLIGSDSKTDVALLQIVRDAGDTEPFPYVKLGDSDKLEVGEWVIAIGNPFGLSHTVTTGIVSAKGRDIGAGPYDEFIQTDAAINPGNSGGPLLNLKGEVVGMNTAIISGSSGGNVGIGFATPINMVSSVLEDLKQDGAVTRGWLGVMIQKLTPELADAFGLQQTSGALVSEVMTNGPAEKGGLKRGDVILKFGHQEIDSIASLPKVVAAAAPGQTVPVKILRNGKPETVFITIEKLEETKA